MSIRESNPTAGAAPLEAELAALELRRRRLALEAEVAALDEQIARARATSERVSEPPPVIPRPPLANASDSQEPKPPPKVARPIPSQPPPPSDCQEPERPAPANRFVVLPGSLVSAALHAVVLLVLALFYLPQEAPRLFAVLESGIANHEDLLSTEEISLQLETSTDPVVPALAEARLESGAVEVGLSPEGLNEAEDFSTSIAATGDLGAVDALFGANKGLTAVGEGAEFFGVKATGNRFVFIVDSSNSMRGDKFRDACEELTYALRRLSSKQFFYVIFFDQDAERMTFAPKKTPEESYAQATAGNLKLVEDWIKTVGNELKTNPYEAVVFARGLAPDAIYLLSDGRFTDKGATERFLRKDNLFNDPGVGIAAKSAVHTIGFYDREGEDTLQGIAKEHKGTYRFVSRPMKK